MANKEIHIPLTVDDKGSTKKKTEEAKALREELEKASKAADNMGIKSESLRKAKERALTPRELVEYNAQRGSAGAAGGTARDFAAQAQGLGGLVRLYATFAANIYAVSTAFNALKEASNVDKMIEASNRFSVVTGNNLTSIAKDLQKATDYTLAFQDAIKFTNIGTAAGLSAKEIQNLTVIAKGAASALGRDVGESIQRIIQGTAKQEQEILDELGIFVKSKKAFEEYAAARNIKVDDLTARQRTLAYADAVAKAGEQWKEFATIEDPYAKLMASGREALQETLSMINKIVTPIIKLFAENADAIKALAVLITTSLVQRALPELKSAFIDAFSFKKIAVKEKAEKAKNDLVDTYTQLNAKLLQLKEQRDKLLVPDMSRQANLRVASGVFDPNAIQRGAGSNIDYGLSLGKATTAVFGTDKNPIDISKYKDVEAVQARISAGIREQLSNEKTRDLVLQNLISKKVIEEGSTYKNLVLSQSTKESAKQLYEYIERQNAATVKRNALEKEYLITQAAVEKSKKNLEKTGILANSLPTTGLPDFVGPPTKGTVAMERLGNTVKGVILSYRDFTHGLTANSEALLRNQATAGQGYIAGLKGFITYLGTYKEQLAVATASTAGFGKVAAATGGTLSFLGGALSIVARGFSAILGPVMLLWTAWEIFGDTIKEWFGWSKKVEEQTKATEEALKNYNSTLEMSTKAQLRANEVLAKGPSTFSELQKAVEVRINALKSEVDAYDKYVAEKLAIRDKEKQAELDNKLGKNIGGIVGEAEAQLKSLETKRFFTSMTVEQARAQGELETKLKSTIQVLKESQGKAGFEGFTEALKESVEEARKLNAEIARTEIVAGEQRSSAINSLATSFDGLTKSLEDLDVDKIKAANMGLDPKAVAAYEGLRKLPKLSELLQSNKLIEFNLTVERSSEVFKELALKTESLKTKSVELAKIRELNTELLAAETQLATASTFAQAENAQRAIDNVKQRMAEFLQGNALGVAKVISDATNAAKNAASELSAAAKAELAKIRLEIDNIENSIKGLQASIKTQDKLTELTNAISGRITGPNPAQLQILEKEEELAKRKAFLVMREVELRNRGNKELAAQAKEVYNSTVRQAEETARQERTLFSINQLEKGKAEAARISADIRARENALVDDAYNIKKAEFDLARATNEEYYKTIGYTSEELSLVQSLAERQAMLVSQEQARDKLARDRQAALEKAALTKSTAEQAATVGTDNPLDLALALARAEGEYTSAVAATNSEFDRQAATMERLNQLALDRNALQLEMNQLLAVQSRETVKVSKLSKGLEGLFKGTGLEKQAKGLSDFIKSTTAGKQKLAILDSKEAKRREAFLEKDRKLSEDVAKGNIEAINDRIKLNKDEVSAAIEYSKAKKDAEFEANLAAIESFKSMMSEKTAGYKVLDAIEKGMHIYRMTIAAIELAADIKNTAVSVANSTTRIGAKTAEAGVDAVGAVIKAISSLPFPANLVAGAATAAVVFALLSSIGGKGKQVSTAGVTAKDRQETQGTGMRWVDGKKVETGGGVFGDAEAKSESIKNSLEIIKENSIEGLSFDNKMLKTLESIDRSIGGVSTSLYRIPGIRTGSAFGTVEGNTAGKGGFLQNFVSQIFGKKSTTQEIIDSGVKIAGSFKELASGAQNLINFYETVKTTTTTSRLFGLSKSTSTSIETSTKGAPPEITQAVSSIFSYATGLFKEVGAKIGKTAEEIDTQLGNINFDQLLSLRDLKGEDLEKEFNAVISSMLDSTADALFAEMKRFQKFGEGMLETVVRVVDANRKLNDALDAIAQSSALKSAGKALDYDITEKLLEAVGGIEAFNDQIELFREEFLTEAERIAPVAKAVRDEMERLGYGMVDTKQEFKALVQGLDLTVPAQRELYASLMLVAKSFAEVYKETEKLLDAEEYRNKIIGMEIEGLRLLGLETMAVAKEREAEIAELNKLVPAQRDQLVYYQKVLYAIEDAMSVRNAEIELLGALGFTYDQLVLQREVELMGLTDQVKAVKKWQNAVEDYNASQDLMIEMLGLVGDGTRATALIRERELKGLNATDKAIKRAIYALEDEQEIREKLRETREQETSTIKDNISATRDYIKSLKDYRSSLLTGNLSPLNPLQKYEQTKSEVMALAAKASAPAVTEEEKRTQKEARDKLQSSTNAWLEASRVLFASSTAYTSDFNTVLSIVDKAIAAAEGTLSDAEKQLEVLKHSESLLGGIEENTKTSAQLMAELSAAQERTAQALANVPEDLAAVYKIDELYAHIATLPEAIKSLPQTLTDAINSVVPLGSAYLPSIPGLPGAGYVGPMPGPGYVGPNIPVLGEPDPAIIEIKGYTIEGNELTKQLINEVISLKNEVASLKAEAKENTNALVNAEIKASVVTGEVVANGVAGAVNSMAWQNNNVVTLR